jgi:hypothetical protein
MSERYWITGVQLGLLNSPMRKTVMNSIIKNQFIGNFYTPKEQKKFAKQMSIAQIVCQKKGKEKVIE